MPTRRTMKLIPTLCCLTLAASLTGQVEHAPTVAQCQADQRLWLSQLEGKDKSTLGFYVFTDMAVEMESCSEVDPPNATKYYNTESEATATQAKRMSKFIQRHQLWEKFLAEDAAGKR